MADEMDEALRWRYGPDEVHPDCPYKEDHQPPEKKCIWCYSLKRMIPPGERFRRLLLEAFPSGFKAHSVGGCSDLYTHEAYFLIRFEVWINTTLEHGRVHQERVITVSYDHEHQIAGVRREIPSGGFIQTEDPDEFVEFVRKAFEVVD